MEENDQDPSLKQLTAQHCPSPRMRHCPHVREGQKSASNKFLFRERETRLANTKFTEQKTAMELLEQYIKFQQGAIENEKKKKKKEKNPLKPKQPVSAFFVFTKEHRIALLTENKNVKEVAKITGEEWKNMTEKQKPPYEEMEQYLQEMEVYKKKKDEEAAEHLKEVEELMKLKKQEALQLLKKKEKTENLIKKTKGNHQKKKQKQEKNVDPNKPKKSAGSVFLFSKEERKKLGRATWNQQFYHYCSHFSEMESKLRAVY
uniref:High mobility group B protein 6-like n=1 Tax=Nicotiana tabacum TaxID=4097 RepID=A0A1S3X7M7_TOBAC|nr:PREDICTED: high mobility group B protein 6-like [Nicotiana tabacum]